MRPVAMVGGLVEANTIRTGSGTQAARLFISIELQVADEGVGSVIEAGEVFGGRLLQWYCCVSALAHGTEKNGRTLLRGPTQDRREWRGSAPDVLQARIILALAFEAGDAVDQLSLILLYPEHLVLEAPDVVAGLKSYALRVHSRGPLIPWWGGSARDPFTPRKPSSNRPRQTPAQPLPHYLFPVCTGSSMLYAMRRGEVGWVW
jgi:hypothetical protein